MEEKVIPKRRLGRTEEEVTVFGLGGEGILRTFGNEKIADSIINTAIDLGVNYMETARAYSGSESYYGKALKGRRDKVFLASKSHMRDAAGARAHLEESLRELKTDHLDLWQIHDVRTQAEVEAIFAPDGALKAFVEAREKGLTRFIGITGHHDPAIIKKCLEMFDFDTVLIPVNPAEPSYKCFIDEIIPVAGAKDTGVIGMKSYLRGQVDAPKRLLFSYALTQPVTAVTIGCDSVEQLKDNVEIAKDLTPLTVTEVQRVTAYFAPYAKDLMYYKP